MEMAFISANRIHIEMEKKKGGVLAKILTKITYRPSRFLASLIIGNCISLVVYCLYMGEWVLEWFQGWLPLQSGFWNSLFSDYALIPQILLTALIFLSTAAFLPRVFFQVYSNVLLKALAIPAYLFHLLLSPVSWSVLRISKLILWPMLRSREEELQLSFGKLELEDYISEHMETGNGEEEMDSEIQIFQNALQFSTLKAREVMVPRTEITAVELGETPTALTKLFIETGYSKILVYKGNIDEIIGYVHSYELFNKPKTIKGMLMPVEFVPETMLIQDILNVLTKKRKSMAVVLDEYG